MKKPLKHLILLHSNCSPTKVQRTATCVTALPKQQEVQRTATCVTKALAKHPKVQRTATCVTALPKQQEVQRTATCVTALAKHPKGAAHRNLCNSPSKTPQGAAHRNLCNERKQATTPWCVAPKPVYEKQKNA